MTAFSTASSAATLPVTMKCMEEKNGVDPRISRSVLPVSATINMDGTALYVTVSAIFIAQMLQVELNFVQVIVISITSTAASIGAAGIPNSGIVMLVMVLTTVGLPCGCGPITIVLTADWLLDRFTTAINVLGDSIGAGIVSHLSSEELAELEAREAREAREAGEVNEGIELTSTAKTLF